MSQPFDFFGVFDYREGDSDVYQYTAGEWSEWFKALCANGVVMERGEELEVTSDSPYKITVGSGYVFIQGRIGKLNVPVTMDVTETDSQRNDYVVARLDFDERTVVLDIKEDSEELTNTSTVYEIPIAQLQVTSTGEIGVTDKRQFCYTTQDLTEIYNSIMEGTHNIHAYYA